MTAVGAVPVAPTRGALRPLGLTEVTITGGFWARRQAVNASATLAHIEHWMEREGWVGNFDAAVRGALPQARRGREFSDSEVYKLLEAMAWEIGRTGDAALDERFRHLVGLVGAAQEADGYLNTQFGRPGQQPRYSQLEWGHELYCYGHLFQAAVARARTRPDEAGGLLEIAIRAADHVCRTFGPDGVQGLCGHPEIELALVELGRATGRRRYVEQAATFVERRGHRMLADNEFGRSYYQDDIPVREVTVLRGHAVRANYLAAGAVDVAVETGDDELLAALVTQWESTVARRTYLTGGQGAHHQDEAFGDDFELPPDRAYSETCAGVGSVMFSWRLLLGTGLSRYADLIERTLFNVVATSASPEGTSFYYTNTLHQRVPGTVPPQNEASPRASSSLRAPWFAVSCCPPNVARTVASLAGYVATTDDGGLQLHQYMPALIHTRLADGGAVDLQVETNYPDSGTVRVRVLGDSAVPWKLTLRIPSWATGATLAGPDDASPRQVRPGSATVTRAFVTGDLVELRLPMKPRVVSPDRRIDAVRGCVAVERGPEVYCLESTDLPAGSDLSRLEIDASSVVESDDAVRARLVVGALPDPPWPYGVEASAHPQATSVEARLIPYHDWATRGPSTMRVWIPATDPQHPARRRHDSVTGSVDDAC